MQSKPARILRGLSIAIFVISIISIVTGLMTSMSSGALVGLTANPDIQASAATSLSTNPDAQAALDQLGITGTNAVSLAGGLFALGGVYLLFNAVLTVFILIASIMGMRAAKNPAKAGSAMGWMIASAILSLISMHIVLIVLSIIAAVFANKLKKETLANFAPSNGQ